MVGLQALGLSQCSSLSGEGVLAVVTNLTALTHLTLHAIHLSTEHICALTKVSQQQPYSHPHSYGCVPSLSILIATQPFLLHALATLVPVASYDC